jgi:hypothetical protein
MTMIRALWPSRPFRALLGLGAFLLVLAGGTFLLAPAADHRDGPIFVNTKANGRADINDVYVFQSPANANNTVLIMTESPGPGPETPPTFDPTVTFAIKVDNTGDAVEDITFSVTFGLPDNNGVQSVTLRALPASRFPPTGIIAQGQTGQNIPIPAARVGGSGGMFRAAIHDDPFFFDATGFKEFIANGPGPGVVFPRPVPKNPASPQPGEAQNFFGPNVNTLAIILEIPSIKLTPTANGIIGVFGTTSRNGVQVDRMGRPAINTALIPPIPRSDPQHLGDRRNAFNAGLPRNDVANFKAPMQTVLTTVYNGLFGTPNAAGLADALLPDMLMFQVGNNGHFGTKIPDPTNGPFLGNGRYLTDPVIHIELSLLTGGKVTTDNVNDDNGGKVTDGTPNPNGGTRTIAFPYIGPANPQNQDFDFN